MGSGLPPSATFEKLFALEGIDLANIRGESMLLFEVEQLTGVLQLQLWVFLQMLHAEGALRVSVAPEVVQHAQQRVDLGMNCLDLHHCTWLACLEPLLVRFEHEFVLNKPYLRCSLTCIVHFLN